MKSCFLLALALSAGGVVSSAMAQQPATATATAPVETRAAETRPAPDRDADQDLAPSERHCLRHTGTRLRLREEGPRRCSPGMGRVWTRRDLESTGQVDIAQALRMLDVSIH